MPCQTFHAHRLDQNQLELGQVPADEIKVRTQKGTLWMAMAMRVATRLGLGGAVSPHRDTSWLQQLARQVRRIALCRPLLSAVDGLNTYLSVFRDALRTGLPRVKGQTARLTWVAGPNIALVQVIKSKQAGLWNIKRVIVQGQPTRIEQSIRTTQATGMLNTAYMERLKATFRQRLAG